jgi:hypothetical protein
MPRALALPLLLATMGLGHAWADEPIAQVTSAASSPSAAPSTVTLSGFGTLGLARSSSPHVEFVRDLSQTSGLKSGHWSGVTDSVLGVQANWQASPQLELVGQAVSRMDYEHSFKPEIMWAFAKWEPDPRLSLRVGRIGADFMMLADSRLVGYSYLPVRPSADFFGPLFFSNFDGFDASLALPLADGIVRGKLFSGWTHEKAAGTPGVWDTSGSPLNGLVLDYQRGPWLIRANRARMRFSHDINGMGMPDLLRSVGQALQLAQPGVAADTLLTKDKTAQFISLGLVYDEGPLLLQGMLNKIRNESGVFEDSKAGYLLAGYRVDSLTPYAGFSFWKSSVSVYPTGMPAIPLLAPLEEGYQTFMRASRADQHTYTLGTRWDFRRNLAFKLQWDAVRGTAASRFPYASADAAWNGKTDVLSLSMDFVF